VVPPERAGSSRGDPTVHQDQLEPAGDALPVKVLQNQRAGPVLVGGGRHDQRAHRKASHVDGHDALDALGAAVGATSVVEGLPAVRGTAGQVGVDDDHRGRLPARPSASRAAVCNTVNARAQLPLRVQRRNCDHTRVQGPNDSGRNRPWQPVWAM
jgi:hypothetical protein